MFFVCARKLVTVSTYLKNKRKSTQNQNSSLNVIFSSRMILAVWNELQLKNIDVLQEVQDMQA